ncbi:ATPase [Desulforamulus aquiferis]|uniref:ATPase n=1 Tax=Desulforamulus aquiferis TaxID=1397668 RepID=A0AAW7ZD36_9FIRM|nr:ATPase [Desulforamulus aquiferis]MDO7787165.1 ATPase [Desulforamulus aquiferis]RYD04861.1 ATPase [Desulforamulus aquiferis]
MELFNVLNELEELIEESPKVPMTKRIMVDENRILDYLDRIRTSLPEEVRQAKWLVKERDKVLSESKKEAQRMLEDVTREIEKRADDSEIVRQAEKLAEETIKKSEEVAAQIRQGAREYADEILEQMEDKLGKILSEIQQGREELRK